MLQVKTPSGQARPCLPPPSTWVQILFLAPTLDMTTYSWPWENRSLGRKMPTFSRVCHRGLLMVMPKAGRT